ncbi:MAG: redoxin domain-containing protein, partial [Methylococcaceae bacterium]|nr:redoxin domain-containing protein [Methylococcaceae bacterium]
MKLKQGDTAPVFQLPAIEGDPFNLETLKGKRYLLSFFRFASCPFCNLRLHQLITRLNEFDEKFTLIAVFNSPLENLTEHVDKHQSPFPILADEKGIIYQHYGVEKSFIGVLKGMIFRMPTLLKAMFIKGYFPSKRQGSMTTMPVDFLIDEQGIIQTAYYGKDEGDHL